MSNLVSYQLRNKRRREWVPLGTRGKILRRSNIGLNARRSTGYHGYRKKGLWPGFRGAPQQKYARFSGVLSPQQLRMNFVFDEEWTDTDADGFCNYAFKGNSIVDPDVSLGGNKCCGVTSWAYLYNRYIVHNATMYVELINQDSNDPVTVAIVPCKSSSAVGAANKEAVYGLPGVKYVRVANQTGAGVVKASLNVAQICGLKDESDEGFASTMVGDPTHLCYFSVYIFNDTGVALNATVRVRIIFDTTLSDINIDSYGV